MSKLPEVSSAECVRALEKAGFYVARQGKHITMRRDNPRLRVTIPNHRTIKKGTLRSIIRQAGLTVDEFVALL
jgi:predicted RNA binding protein YcfA (HicA-like mRNA interferase family)